MEKIQGAKTTMIEARRAPRHRCNEAVDCEVRGRILYAYMMDISLRGAKLRGMQLPEVGTLLRIAPSFENQLGRKWIYCQVCWISRGEVEEAGIRFLEPAFCLQDSWVNQFIYDAGPAERRQSVRIPTELHVEVRMEGLGRTFEATSLDLSQGGTQIKMPKPVRPGSLADLYLCLPWTLLEVPAQVVTPKDEGQQEHSLRFLELSPDDECALECFIKEELAESAPPVETAGMQFLQLLNS